MPLDWTVDAEQRGLAACLRQRDDNAHRKLLTCRDRQLLNQVIHANSLGRGSTYDARLSAIATRVGNGGGNTLQRGTAAYLRQHDIASRRLALDDRQFLDRVIHDASLSHSPHYDARLSGIAMRLGVHDPVVYYTPTHKAVPVQRLDRERQDRERRERETRERRAREERAREWQRQQDREWQLHWAREQRQRQTFVAAADEPSPAWCSLL